MGNLVIRPLPKQTNSGFDRISDSMVPGLESYLRSFIAPKGTALGLREIWGSRGPIMTLGGKFKQPQVYRN